MASNEALLEDQGGTGDAESCADSVAKPCCLQLTVTVLVSLVGAVCFFHRRIAADTFREGLHYMPLYQVVAVLAAIVASANSFHHIFQHITQSENKGGLKWSIRIILLVVPVYAICSACALVSEKHARHIAIIFTALREFYEAYVLVAFIRFVAEYWGGAQHLAGELDDEVITLGTVAPHPLRPFLRSITCCGRSLANVRPFPLPRAPGSDFVAKTFIGVLQYALVMWLVLFANLAIWGALVGGGIDLETINKVKTAVKVAKLISNMYCMHNLLVLYEYLMESQDTKERMGKIKPLSKFVCIKAIVLFSLWQEGICQQLSRHNMLPRMQGYKLGWRDQESVADAVVNFLVCIEMIAFAQWHRYAYPYSERLVPDREGGESSRGLLQLFKDIFLLLGRAREQRAAIRMVKRRYVVQQEELKKAFETFDTDSSGTVSVAQLRFLIVQCGLATWAEAGKTLRAADHDHNNRLSWQEFQGMINYEKKGLCSVM